LRGLAILDKMIGMPRTRRYAPGGMVFHALNRGLGRMEILSKDEDYAAFEETIEETLQRYQGRFKSFPVETDDHFYTVVRYVERNAARANLVESAEAWRWGSLWRRTQHVRSPLLATWPLPEPAQWRQLVNRPQTEAELEAVRRCVRRGKPFGAEHWAEETAKALGLESTLRPRGRPKDGGNRGTPLRSPQAPKLCS